MNDDKTNESQDRQVSSGLLRNRFNSEPDKVMERINSSIDFDHHLYIHDIAASQAHCRMLIKQKIIPEDDGHKILKGLEQIETEITNGSFIFTPTLEDIHMHIEARLIELIGDAGGRLHTARSRNDQVATDFRLWVREAIDNADDALKLLQRVLIDQAEVNIKTIMPGFTHLQSAQPVTLAHHFLAYYEMLDRDRSRLADCRKRLNLSPLGAGALAGTSIPIDRTMTALELGFDGPCNNSMDAVADRDFAIEFLSCLSICIVHLSRLSEELVIWSTPQFNFVVLPDGLTTGSSMMPQKKNPDAAELIRGKSGGVIGSLTTLLILIKGLPLTYSKDMQEDKVPTFDAFESVMLSISAMTAMISKMKVNTEVMSDAAGCGYSTATDLADWLVKELSLPFRKAHQATAQIIRIAESNGINLQDVPLKQMQMIEPGITPEAISILNIDKSIDSRTSFGGTAPSRVYRAISEARKRIDT